MAVRVGTGMVRRRVRGVRGSVAVRPWRRAVALGPRRRSAARGRRRVVAQIPFQTVAGPRARPGAVLSLTVPAAVAVLSLTAPTAVASAPCADGAFIALPL